MAKSPEQMKASMIAGMAEKTGKSLDQWLAIVRASKLTKHKEFMTLLKEKHGLTHGFANMVALQALQSDSHTAGDTDALVDAQYAGAKAPLRPLYDKLLAAIQSFGKDVEVSPKKAYVSLRRNKQFAIAPAFHGNPAGCGHQPEGDRADRAIGGIRQLQCHGQPPRAAVKARGDRQETAGLAEAGLRGVLVSCVKDD